MNTLAHVTIGVLVSFALTSCGKEHEPAPTRESALHETTDSVPDAYRGLFGPFGNPDTVRSRLPFDSISIERTACMGTCPIYRAVFYRDGSCRLNAVAYMPLEGEFTGGLSLRTYGRLCFLIENTGFAELDSLYLAPVSCQPTVIIKVSGPGLTKEVSEYGDWGPVELWALQRLLDGVVKDEVEWVPVRANHPDR